MTSFVTDDGKRTEMACTKLTERMFIDLNRAAATDERSLSDYLYRLIRRDLYGRMVPRGDEDDKIHSHTR